MHGAQRQQFRIQVDGHLPDSWPEWFAGHALQRQADGTTIVVGECSDQAGLFGVLWRIRDLGVPLLSVDLIEEEESDHE